jgi:hypothetical protein
MGNGYRIKIGKEFEEVEVSLDDDGKDDEQETKPERRDRLKVASAVFGTGVAFLSGAAILGIVQNDFTALNHVWAVASVPISSIVTFYFTRTAA